MGRGLRALALPLAIAAVVLVLAAVAGYGLSQVVAQMASAPGPRSTLPPRPIATTQPSPSPTDALEPSASVRVGPSPTPLVHVVQRGEFVSQIAERYGVSVEAILRLNDILDPNYVEVGQELLIPVGDAASPAPSSSP
jgi:LysM repeat protein